MIEIQNHNFRYKKFTFPCGELHVEIDDYGFSYNHVRVTWEFENVSEIFEMSLLSDILKRQDVTFDLFLPYVPFSRQDRANTSLECFSLKTFAKILNDMGAIKVTIVDPHSDVTTALINNCVVIPQHEIFSRYFEGKSNFYLVSPDGGALKKIYKLASFVEPLGVIECSKLRDTKTGAITGTIVHAEDLKGTDCYIVDDICDGGKTFIEIAKILKLQNAGKITLMVTHGFFTKGLQVFDGLIDEIYTRKGKVK